MVQRRSRKMLRPRIDEMVTSLRNQIITSALKPDTYLPSEKQLASKYDLSVQSVRKGLTHLQEEGLILKIPKVGNKVLDPAEKGAVVIRLGYSSTIPDDADIHRLIAMFHQKYPNIRVQAVSLGENSYEQLVPYLENGVLDVLTVNYNLFLQFRENGALDNFELLDRQEPLYSFLSDAFTTDGQIRVQPFVFSPIVLGYNRSHFQELQLPEPNSSWDWQRLFDCATALEIPNERVGFRCYFSSPHRASILLLQRGHSFERDPNGRLRIPGTRMMEAIRYSKQIYDNIPSIPNSLMGWDSQKFELFLQGKVSMIVLSYFQLNHFRDSDLDYDIAPLPHFDEAVTPLIIIGLAINRRSQNKEAAAALVDFLVSHEAQRVIRQNRCSLPARISAAESSEPFSEPINRPSRFSLFREIMPSYRLFTDLNITEREYSKLYSELRLYWAGLGNGDGFFVPKQ